MRLRGTRRPLTGRGGRCRGARRRLGSRVGTAPNTPGGRRPNGSRVQREDGEELERQGGARLSPGKRKLPERLLGKEPVLMEEVSKIYIMCLIKNLVASRQFL